MTVWTDFVKKYAADKGISYKAALSQASGPYKSRGETKKPSEGTVQVKRNVAQRGLADIAAKQQQKQEEVKIKKRGAKRDLESIALKARKKAFIKRSGVTEDLIQEYVDLDGIYRRYVGLEFTETPKRIQNAIDRFDSVLTDIYQEISTGDESPQEFFYAYDEAFAYDDLGYSTDSDDEDGYHKSWYDDAAQTIRGFTADAKNLLKRIIDYKSGKNYGE